MLSASLRVPILARLSPSSDDMRRTKVHIRIAISIVTAAWNTAKPRMAGISVFPTSSAIGTTAKPNATTCGSDIDRHSVSMRRRCARTLTIIAENKSAASALETAHIGPVAKPKGAINEGSVWR